MSSVRIEPTDRRNLLILIGVLGAFYGLLITNHWNTGPDTAYYIGVARSLLTGHGYEFNGVSVGRAPPGYPFFLSMLMWVSRSFAFLQISNVLLQIYAGACGYLILRRFMNPAKSFWLSILGGMLYWSYSSSTQLRTEALFCAIFMQTLLWGLQMSEGKRFRFPLVLTGLVLMTLVRFASIPAWVVVAGAMMNGIRLKKGQMPQERRIFWTTLGKAVLSLGVALGSFQVLGYVLSDILPRYTVSRPLSPGLAPGTAPLAIRDFDLSEKEDESSPRISGLLVKAPVIRQGSLAGEWFSSFFCMPMQVLQNRPLTELAVNLYGWAILAFMMVAAFRFAKSGSYLPACAILYALAISFAGGM